MTTGRTIAFNGSVRLYVTPGRGSGAYAFSACSRWSRRRVFLLETDEPRPFVEIAGRSVAAVGADCSGGERVVCDGWVFVVDMQRRRSWTTELPRLPDGRPGLTVSLAVTARGWTAWTAYRRRYNLLEVWAMAPGGEIRQLDAGAPSVEASGDDTLAVAGDRVYWELADGPRSALLR